MRASFKLLVFGLLAWHSLAFTNPLSLEESLERAIPIQQDQHHLVGYLHIDRDRPIDQSTYLYVKFALEHYRKLGVSFILLDLNTPGGEVFASMKIADLLHKIDAQDHIPVVAFIDNWAISAGAMLAFMLPGSSGLRIQRVWGLFEPIISRSRRSCADRIGKDQLCSSLC